MPFWSSLIFGYDSRVMTSFRLFKEEIVTIYCGIISATIVGGVVMSPYLLIFPLETLNSKDVSVNESSVRMVWYSSLLDWSMLVKKVVQGGKILVAAKTGHFVWSFNQILVQDINLKSFVFILCTLQVLMRVVWNNCFRYFCANDPGVLCV